MIHSLIVRDRWDASYFTGEELAAAGAFKLQKRRDEWLLARYAAKQLALRLGIVDDPRACTVGRPALLVNGAPCEWHVSLSHSASYGAAALARGPVGIDIQVVREIAEWSSHLFMTAEEAETMRRCTIPHRILHFWCAKEAAWKQRSSEFATMKQVPLVLLEERRDGLLFDCVETSARDDLIVAITTAPRAPSHPPPPPHLPPDTADGSAR